MIHKTILVASRLEAKIFTRSRTSAYILSNSSLSRNHELKRRDTQYSVSLYLLYFNFYFLYICLAQSREYLDEPYDNKPCKYSNYESYNRSEHSLLGLINSWAITCDTRVKLHLHCMVYEWYYCYCSCNSEEYIDYAHEYLRNGIHIDITSTEIIISDIISLIKNIRWRIWDRNTSIRSCLLSSWAWSSKVSVYWRSINN